MAGRLGALLMARIGGPMHEWAIDLLDPQPGDHVLEIGPAHGALIQRMAARVPEVQLAGVDPSADMVRLATRRNQTLAGEGRLDIRHGSVSAIPFNGGSFHGVVTTNTVYFWPDLDADLDQVVRVLQPGGRLVIGFRAGRDEMDEWHVASNGGSGTPSSLSIVGLRNRCAVAGLVNLRARLRHLQGRGPFGRMTMGAIVGEKRIG